MIRHIAFFIMLCISTSAYAMPIEDAIKESRVFAEKQDYERALSCLKQAETQYPNDLEIKLAIIRTLSWQGDFVTAEKRLASLDTKYDANADVQLLRANLAFYRKEYAIAETRYRTILLAHPDYEDAKAGLERIEKVKHTSMGATRYAWQLDMGYEHSSFSRVNQSGWNQSFVQLNRFLSDTTAVHGKIIRYEQFTNLDTAYELGVDHRFADYVNGYVYGVISPNADFRPEKQVMGGGMLRILNKEYADESLWLTLDNRYDIYDAIKVLDINPGLRFEPMNGWAISVRKISVDADNAKRVYGEDYRLDGTIIDGLRFYVGYANAPETESAITIDTKTWFGGIVWDVNEYATLRCGYSHDDRKNSYIREVVSVSTSIRF